VQNCDCRRGFRGIDCSIECLGGAANPCSGYGTKDNEDNAPVKCIDEPGCEPCIDGVCRNYECERDGSCVCESEYVGVACGVLCEPTPERHFKESVGVTRSCECVQEWTGFDCSVPESAEDVSANITDPNVALLERFYGGASPRRASVAVAAVTSVIVALLSLLCIIVGGGL